MNELSKSIRFVIGDDEYTIDICSTPTSSFGIFFSCVDVSLYAYICLEDYTSSDLHSNLRVIYNTRSYASNTNLLYRRREIHNTDTEILTARLIDRSIRSNFPRLHKKTEINILLVRRNNKFDINVATMMAANILCKLYLGDKFTFNLPIKITLQEQNVIINRDVSHNDTLNCYMCINTSGINLIELYALHDVHYNILCDTLEKVYDEYQKYIHTVLKAINEHIQNTDIKQVEQVQNEQIEEALKEEMHCIVTQNRYKGFQNTIKTIHTKAVQLLSQCYDDIDETELKRRAQVICKNAFLKYYTTYKIRIDGRKFNEIREVTINNNNLLGSHGSAILHRGYTTVLGNITISEQDSKIGKTSDIYVHYNFHNFAVNETTRANFVTRREIGHGAIITRAINYATSVNNKHNEIRIVTEVLSSDGSSSMLGVMCACILCNNIGMHTKTIVGIGYGAMRIDGDIVLIKDINGIEDDWGLMDMKVVIHHSNVVYIQLDSKETIVTTKLLRLWLHGVQVDTQRYANVITKQETQQLHKLLQEKIKINIDDNTFDNILNTIKEIEKSHSVQIIKEVDGITIYGTTDSIVIAAMKVQNAVAKSKTS